MDNIFFGAGKSQNPKDAVPDFELAEAPNEISSPSAATSAIATNTALTISFASALLRP
jgi:hypothetical protein